MDLLSPQDIQDVFSAFYDLEDTFFKYEATLIHRTKKLSAFNDSRAESMAEQQYTVSLLAVPDKNDTDAENRVLTKGSADFTEAAFYVYYDTLKTLGLIDSKGEIIANAATDTFLLDGIEYDIFGINRVGPFGGRWVLAKFHVKKAIK